jgi:hypothetical protein
MKTRMKRSPIWTTHTDEEFRELFRTSQTITELLSHFGLLPKGGNGRTLRARCENLGLSYDDKAAFGRQVVGVTKRQQPENEMLCSNSTASRRSVKALIRRKNLIPYVCARCSLSPMWNGDELVLVLDHINGVSNDNRLENLRFVCPNCNSQLGTHAGRNKRIRA